ncbi:MAG TPA: ATP-binding cassette domain-containing protein [Acidimicrobiales bacterium]|nr:ATP-binding cassette domain-containing protein [Acidimicrobiales bacterium]
MIEVRGLTKRYGDKIAVEDLSFNAYPGVVTGFLGPNGSGKSTTMRVIMGLDHPNGGTATINGRPYHDLDWPLREVGALLEARAIHPGRTARSHLWMLAQTNQIARSRVDEVLDIVGLTEVANQLTGKFSLGMSQRLGIAASLLGDPGVLLYDEPVNGLDAEGIRWVRNLLIGLARQGRTLFVSSHLMSEMAQMADDVVVIGRGRLITQALMSDLLAGNQQSFVRVRSPGIDPLVVLLETNGARISRESDGSISVSGLTEEMVGDLAFEAGIALHELAPVNASLEEVFMELTEESVEYHGAPGGSQ